MEYDGGQHIGGPPVEKPHDNRREKGKQRPGVAIKKKLGKMHYCEEDAYEQKRSEAVAGLLLEESSEIHLLWKRDARELIKYRTERGWNKDFTAFHGKIPERKEYNQRCKETHSDISQREPEVNPLSHDIGNGKEKNRDEILKCIEGRCVI